MSFPNCVAISNVKIKRKPSNPIRNSENSKTQVCKISFYNRKLVAGPLSVLKNPASQQNTENGIIIICRKRLV